MPGDKKAEQARECRLVEIADLYRTGMSQKDIGRKLGMSKQLVFQDIQLIRRGWLESQTAHYDERKAAELEKIDYLEFTAREAWERSIGKMTKTENTTGEKGYDKTIEWEEAGDPRFLAVIMDCIKKRCAIFGLDAPTKNEDRVSHEHSGNITVEQRRIELLGIVSTIRNRTGNGENSITPHGHNGTNGKTHHPG